ncbi:hypothetical protein [Microbacterium allomyrinae]|uniref:Uncharacterized protein n=1 Tax=Microbacterium allomyrinae TaxID=2830666 RepID=A0A9X1LTC3_9MICO|nr:hypothetical protein [Microbacterium allomyrinae]MCC2031442.1 hypothetical protein [Microbacterium allomyrinae]
MAVLMVGCSSTGVTYSALDREAEPADELPAVVIDGNDEIAVETARYVGEHGGAGLWLARTEEPDTVCLIVYPGDQDWVTGCGAEGGPFIVGGPSGEYAVGPDGAPAPEGSSQLTENVYVVTN